jgi:hypothetical protein
MSIRKLIDFFSPQQQKQQAPPVQNVSASPEPAFDWPPSAEDVAAFSVVELRPDEAPERTPVRGFADVA